MPKQTAKYLDPEQTARAEEMVDRFAKDLSSWTSRMALDLMRAGARAREEAEDIWAEARAVANQADKTQR